MRAADYYDSMFHSVAVVGVNTSALIESGIVGRPVFTVLAAEFAGSRKARCTSSISRTSTVVCCTSLRR